MSNEGCQSAPEVVESAAAGLCGDGGGRMLRAVLCAGAALVSVVVLCTTVASAAPATGPHPGGVYRVGWETNFSFTDNFDPTGEYLVYAFAIYTNLLVRTLVSYDNVAGPAGNKLVSDIA